MSNNRKKGAQKAAQTRRAKTTPTEPEETVTEIVYCGECGEMYEEETEPGSSKLDCM